MMAMPDVKDFYTYDAHNPSEKIFGTLKHKSSVLPGTESELHHPDRINFSPPRRPFRWMGIATDLLPVIDKKDSVVTVDARTGPSPPIQATSPPYGKLVCAITVV